MARSRSLRPSMACSFCAPQSRAGGAMVAQELDQLVSTALERCTKAMVAMKFLGFVRQHPVHTWPCHLRACLCEFQEIYAGRPPSGSGSCQRGRDRKIHRPRSSRPCSELPGLSWRLGMKNLAHFAILTWPAPPPPPTPSRSNNTKADHGGSNHLTNALR
jgi:hypothetical protein